MAIQYTLLMCIFYGIPEKIRVNFMPVFKIGAMLLTLEGERIAVVLGRRFDPRSHAKGRGEHQGCIGCSLGSCAVLRSRVFDFSRTRS